MHLDAPLAPADDEAALRQVKPATLDLRNPQRSLDLRFTTFLWFLYHLYDLFQLRMFFGIAVLASSDDQLWLHPMISFGFIR